MIFFIPSFSYAGATSAKPYLSEIEFTPIELSQENINKFPFMQSIANENNKQRKRWEDNVQMDLTLPNEFQDIKVKISHNLRINQEVYDVITVDDRFGMYCFNGGCSVSFYKNGIQVGGFYDGGGMPLVLHCSNMDYIFANGGPGMSPKPFKIISISRQENLELAHRSITKNPEHICNELADYQSMD